MTRRAQRRERGFTRLRIAHQHVELNAGWIASGWAALSAHGRVNAVNVFRNRDRIGFYHRQRRRVFGDGLTDLFTVLILKRDSRSKQVRALRTSAKVGRVAT